MSPLPFFLLEITICLSITITTLLLIKPPLNDLLIELCGNEVRAKFWVMFTQIMLIISPLLIVIYFTPTYTITAQNLLQTLTDLLFQTLLGTFITLAMIGQIVRKSISRAIQSDTSPSVAEAS
ncbi:MAG: hypothetical protein MI754_17500 [Chromatiales bacterium]|nr:hypothetical protein [Chromatiales bacterium]